MDLPPDMDPRWPRLLAAARAWRAAVVPGTSTASINVVRVLTEAIAAFDPPTGAAEPCEHPRRWHVYHPGGVVECGACGVTIAEPVAGTKPLALPPQP